MHALVGTWRLIKWTVSIGGRTVRPFGGSAVGLLTYTDEGRMMASLMRKDRDMLDTSSFAGAEALNRAGAAAGYISYAGSYEIVGNEVHHDVELSLFPDWVGATQSRRIEWVEEPDGRTALQLSYVQPGAGKNATNTLLWHRIVPKEKAWTTLAHWTEAAASVDPRNKMLIDGEWVDSSSGKTFETVNPATGLPITSVAEGTEADINAAVSSARAAFEDGRWSNLNPRDRGQTLIKLAKLIEGNGDELQLLETLDVGKPIRYSRRVDVAQAVHTYSWYGEAADKLYDDIAPTGPDALGLITREPIGVVGSVTTWNFPMMINSWKLAPALVAGNSVVLKPAEQSPLSALRVAELALEAGIPPGVLNVVPGYGETAGRALGLHPDVDGITFTGSTEVGKLFLQYAGQSNMKRVSAETGGKTPNIIFADAPDLAFAIGAVGFSIFWNTGEMCIAGSRLLVERSVYDRVVEEVGELSKSWMPGDPLDPATKAGPIVDQAQLDRVLHYVQRGQEQGARLVAGGNRSMSDSGGYYIEPTVFADVNNDMDIARDEIFGPVLSIIPFDTEQEALAIANETKYGLSAAVWTSDLGRAHRMSAALKAGTVWINNFDTSDITAPFGGYKESGFGGKDKSLLALDKYTNVKTTWINLGRGGV